MYFWTRPEKRQIFYEHLDDQFRIRRDADDIYIYILYTQTVLREILYYYIKPIFIFKYSNMQIKQKCVHTEKNRNSLCSVVFICWDEGYLIHNASEIRVTIFRSQSICARYETVW